MKNRHSQTYLIIAFVFAQLAWLGLLGLWIYWYVTNYLIIEQVGDKLSPQIIINSPNVLIFVGGIILIVGIALVMFLTFRNLTVQIKLTNLYDNFISNITHELKSPLSSIQLYLETLDEKIVPLEKQKEFFSMMKWDTNRLNKLINSILEISRIEQKRIAHDYNVFDTDKIIPELIGNSITLFRLSEKAIKLECKVDKKCVLDKDAMQIVFDNLIDNAVKYSGKQLELDIKLSVFLEKIIIEISDNGIGITPKELKKVFHKFYRIDNRMNPSVKGTGLGLYWVKEILKLHNGKISCTSEGLNNGTCFKIILPVFDPAKKYYFNSLLRKTAKKQKYLDD